MRRFSSYGPVNSKLHYYAPRKDLLERAYTRLMGEVPEEGGHYITVWAPRQCGKTWTMQQVLFQLQEDPRYDALKINLEHLKFEESAAEVIHAIATEIGKELKKDFSQVRTQAGFQEIFSREVLEKPLILIMDEFDALKEDVIQAVVGAFRNIHIKRMDEIRKSSAQKNYLLHAVALIGVRSVLGIENAKGSPFNVQRSLHISNLTAGEVREMFQWYQRETGQTVEPDVVDTLFKETRGQPGLTCWLCELLTETYNETKDQPINLSDFRRIYAAATFLLPSNNVLNIISKVKEEPYRKIVLELFRTGDVMDFSFDNKSLNYLYMHGAIEPERVSESRFVVRFANAFLQKRLFNYFSGEYFSELGRLTDPFDKMEDAVTETGLNIPNLMKRYQSYLRINHAWLLKDAPRRKDMRIYEAVFHFNLFMFLATLLKRRDGRVYPEFPTGNGKIDLVVEYRGQTYGMELKGFTDVSGYQAALPRAAEYGNQLGLNEISLVFFIEAIDDKNRKKLETVYKDKKTGVSVIPIFVVTEN